MKSTKQKTVQAVQTKYQTFKVETIHRSELVNADYNPRTISDDALKRLSAAVKKLGIVQPPVWNRRTGRVVGGHQRLRALDALHRTNDYTLDVAVIDVDEKQEVETNLALNNESIMGDFDLDLMADLKDRFDMAALDFKAAGFTDADLDLMFDGEFSSQFFEDDKEVTETKEKLNEIKAVREKAAAGFKENLSDEFFFAVICESRQQKEELLKRLGVPGFETYISSSKVFDALKTDV
jgi:hypothetical protein